jgi:threonine dehydrogenase-like Zn-dependent dehydrogenase
VDALGEGVRGLAEGDRVALLSTAAFAEYDVAPAERTVLLPRGLTGPFPGEALGCAVNVARRSALAAGQDVAVVGAGFLGLAVVRLAALAGARVVALSRRETARAAALAQGAAAAEATGEGAAARALALTGGRGFDVVVEAIGTQAGLDLASALPREGGRLVIAGFHQDGLRAVDLCAWNWRGLELVNAHERDPAVQRAGVEEAARLAAAGRLDVSSLYRTFPLEALDAAFRAMEERPDGFVKGLVLA